MSAIERITLAPAPKGWEPDEDSPAPPAMQERAVRLSETAVELARLAEKVEQPLIAIDLAGLSDVVDARARAIRGEWSS